MKVSKGDKPTQRIAFSEIKAGEACRYASSNLILVKLDQTYVDNAGNYFTAMDLDDGQLMTVKDHEMVVPLTGEFNYYE